MAALDFPASPTNGQKFGDFQYDSSIPGWRALAIDSGIGSRVTALETANASTNQAGLVPIIPTSVVVNSGSATFNSAGVITFSGVNSINPRGIFTQGFSDYVIRVTQVGNASSANYAGGYFTVGASAAPSAYYSGSFYRQTTSTGLFATDNVGTNGYFTAGYISTDPVGQYTFTITDPYNKTFSCDFMSSYYTGAHTTVWGGMGYNGSSLIDGFLLYLLGGGTFSGRMQVLGYRK